MQWKLKDYQQRVQTFVPVISWWELDDNFLHKQQWYNSDYVTLSLCSSNAFEYGFYEGVGVKQW